MVSAETSSGLAKFKGQIQLLILLVRGAPLLNARNHSSEYMTHCRERFIGSGPKV